MKTSLSRLLVSLLSLVAAVLELGAALVRLGAALLLRAAAIVRPRAGGHTAPPRGRPRLRVVRRPDLERERLTSALVGMGFRAPAVHLVEARETQLRADGWDVGHLPLGADSPTWRPERTMKTVLMFALCGATTGGFVRLNADGQKWLKKFLARGGGLCPECANLKLRQEKY